METGESSCSSIPIRKGDRERNCGSVTRELWPGYQMQGDGFVQLGDAVELITRDSIFSAASFVSQ